MNALIVGAGRMGILHRRVLRDLGLDVSTVDPDPTAGADHLTVPHEAYDVVCIAAPIDHLADEAARWEGHEGWLLIEKPAAPSLEQARDLAYLLAGQRVAVGYVERFNPQVRALREQLTGERPIRARFTRCNDRPTPSVTLDLQSHDLDLAAHLGLTCPTVFDTRAEQPIRRREVTVCCENRRPLVADLMDHDTSPLHAQWHAFLSDRPGYATLDDAVAVLEALDPRRLGVAA